MYEWTTAQTGSGETRQLQLLNGEMMSVREAGAGEMEGGAGREIQLSSVTT